MRRVAVELNAGALRGVTGPRGTYPLPLLTDLPGHELPLVISLEKSTADIGHAGAALVRAKAHLVCRNFLPHVGVNGPKAPRWTAGRHKLDANGALALVMQRLHPLVKSAGQTTIALPGYLSLEQSEAVHVAARKAKMPLAGSVSAPLAAALIAFAEQTWMTSAVVVDLDDHALTLAHVHAIDGCAQLAELRAFPTLGLKAWKERILNSLADVCVWQTRRDPRDTPSAEQHLYEQLDPLLESALQGRTQQIGVQGNHWYQNLLVTPEQTIHFCGQLVKSLQAEVDRFLETFRDDDAAPVFLMTHGAGRIPGLATILRRRYDVGVREAVASKPRPKTTLEDFGESLLTGSGQALAGAVILTPDAVARGAHALECEPGEHCDEVVPLPLPLPVEAGPGRLTFQGQNYYLPGTAFTLGSHNGSQLLFDAQRHPGVAGKHCEIAFERKSFVLTNRCREGTLVNDGLVHHSIVLQAGDWIRLGAQGPLVRFLGHDPWRGPKATPA
jgi:hypothetical protein